MGAAIAILCILLLATLMGVLAYAAVVFAARVVANRRGAWVAVRPDLSEVPVEYLPPAVRPLVARAEPALAARGFGLAACGHAPEFAVWAAWSQVLFLNRATGERASVLGIFEPATQTDQAELIIATEFRGGAAVQASVEVGGEASGTAGRSGPAPLDLSAALAEHRRRVDAAAADLVTGGRTEAAGHVLPAAGQEVAWLRARAERVAADTARRLRFAPDQGGRKYRPRWSAAITAAARQPLGRPKVSPRGFAVRMTTTVGSSAPERL